MAASHVSVKMINDERWIAGPDRQRTNAYQSRLLITRFAWSDKNKASIEYEQRKDKEKLM